MPKGWSECFQLGLIPHFKITQGKTGNNFSWEISLVTLMRPILLLARDKSLNLLLLCVKDVLPVPTQKDQFRTTTLKCFFYNYLKTILSPNFIHRVYVIFVIIITRRYDLLQKPSSRLFPKNVILLKIWGM